MNQVYTVQTYCVPDTLESAYAMLRQGRGNLLLGGGAWMALGKRNIQTIIDLKKLGLDQIEEEEGSIVLGAMLPLRALERDRRMIARFGGGLSRCVAHIGGVQLRNTATIGGSVYSRFGFSDLLTALLALESEVLRYRRGAIPLKDYLAQAREKDLITGVRVPDDGRKLGYTSLRLTYTDIPALTAAVCAGPSGWQVAVGARPQKPVLAQTAMDALDSGAPFAEAGRRAAEELRFGSDLRGSADYRRAVAGTLVARAAGQLSAEEGSDGD